MYIRPREAYVQVVPVRALYRSLVRLQGTITHVILVATLTVRTEAIADILR